jgi:2-amino-4-hydroxy-6-hydroxymethyldihydropteridine diphosphokinase
LKGTQKISLEWAFISIGSNIQPEKHLPLAIPQLRQVGKILRTSRVYQNPPLNRPEQADFLNAAVLLETNFDPLEIHDQLRMIEARLGRVRTDNKFAARKIDLDLCLLGDKIMDTLQITLPHPDLLIRDYLAIPISELAPDFRHPVSGETLRQIANRLRLGAVFTYREDVTERVKEALNRSA